VALKPKAKRKRRRQYRKKAYEALESLRLLAKASAARKRRLATREKPTSLYAEKPAASYAASRERKETKLKMAKEKKERKLGGGVSLREAAYNRKLGVSG